MIPRGQAPDEGTPPATDANGGTGRPARETPLRSGQAAVSGGAFGDVSRDGVWGGMNRRKLDLNKSWGVLGAFSGYFQDCNEAGKNTRAGG